jgi:hypothetical protein
MLICQNIKRAKNSFAGQQHTDLKVNRDKTKYHMGTSELKPTAKSYITTGYK